MNIFVLDKDPRIAARMQCDKHIPKMVLETAQMLSTAVNICGVDYGYVAPYKSAHINHPCSVWARESNGNFFWLYDHGMALAKEYEERFGREHKSKAVLKRCGSMGFICTPDHGLALFDDITPQYRRGLLTPHPLCMPDEYKGDCVVESYRRFYIGEKARFAQWNKSRKAPSWWPQTTTHGEV